MSPELLTILPNLSIGVVCIGALVYVVVLFVRVLDKKDQANEASMKEREEALRRMEREVRIELVGALQRSNAVIESNAKIMERVVNHLDRN